MIRTFIVGLVLGLAAAGTAAYLLPVADLQREPSIVSVVPNGGTAETFHIRLPDDRMLAGTLDGAGQVPGTLRWPRELQQAGVEMELFRLRDVNGIVIGAASRVHAYDAVHGETTEWMLHVPARGSLYFPMQATPAADGSRVGLLGGGDREFAWREGELSERVISEEGRDVIELYTILRAPLEAEVTE